MRYLIILFWLISVAAFAQKPKYVDYKPSYKEWNTRYILDKITYWNDRTVFHFRYAAYSFGGGMTFYGPANEINRWALVNTSNPLDVYPEIELRKITREGYTIYNVYQEDNIGFSTKPYEIFTVEVHFPALPSHVTEVDFLEGITKRTYSNHFHCFKVKIKPFNDPDLGNAEDMKKRIDVFEIRTLGWAKTSLGQVYKDVEKPLANEKPKDKEPTKPKEILKPKDREAQAEGKSSFELK